ncbi:MAG TPA: type III pantothenate kinase [Candidatus Mediterraneibacter stercorigallinarum]|uniref:Type III pantothenate kinase n=1 Tax=Candidatus Mediterraneibacter stercorigallinarum TaxID=2838686 RepID=A0A9D2D991_9FIRM|nr:type III pantothenate kinase [Candidatus Mediterraneibacter stercorigallinarum]
MLLTIDVGNTNITMGVFQDEFLQGMFRMTTKQSRTSDEYGFTICGILEHRGIDPKNIDAVIIASVVPDIMHSLTSGIIKYLDATPVIVSHETPSGIRVNTDQPSRTGADRIVNAVAGYAIAKGPVIVVDFGTATTYDLIGPDGTLDACIIAPGIETAGRSLWGGAAMLPAIQIRKPESILAKETVSGMQGGLVYGAVGQTEYIVKKMKEESGYSDAYVIATGGLGKIIARETDCIDLYDPRLTLNGLRMIYDRTKEN